MQKTKAVYIFLSVAIGLLVSNHALATHNRAGEITYEQIGDLTIRATITTYTRTSSFAADRDSLELFWGDGTSTFVTRSNGKGQELPNDIKVNYYIAEHTYPTRSKYKMSVTDPNRIAGILNIDFPNSVNIQFYIETTLTLVDSRFQGRNSSAILLQPPIDFACVDQVFTHNPNAYDPDGDSLAYELIAPFEEDGVVVPNYNLPDKLSPGPNNKISLDPVTGDFVWNSPKVQGEFNITILIKEYRENILINQIIRDMQILVRSCRNENVTPQIETIDEICVVAGEQINFDVFVSDEDEDQILYLTALGGPFELVNSPARFDADSIIRSPMGKGTLSWQTTCDHIQEEPYQIVFRVSDDFFGNESGLATLKTVRIKVLGPAPEDVSAEKVSSSGIRVSWASPYACEADNSIFRGFSVWRREGSNQLDVDSCQGGLEGKGYEKIVFLTNDKEGDRYAITDIDVGDEDIYCYRVVAEFAQVTGNQNLYNRTASLPSNESCERFDRKDPLITKVSITSTDPFNGSVEINWTLPIPDDIDTVANSGPYTIQLQRAAGLSGSAFEDLPLATFASITFSGLETDTIFIDQGLNTLTEGYNYRVLFSNSGGVLSSSPTASTVFNSAVGKDHRIDLSWDENVPWNNFDYNIYEITDDGQTVFKGNTPQNIFSIDELSNGEEYCFLIESIGSYGLRSVREPLINYSQIVCAVPTDSIAPCPPSVAVSTLCEQANIAPDEILINTISYQFDNITCHQTNDLIGINIYYRLNEIGQFEFIDFLSKNDISFSHVLDDNISGCYALTAVDSSGNESSLGNEICVDNCPNYALPNTFTPNNDQKNDIFVPIVNRFIFSIEMEIYNRWGEVVFRTENPSIEWDGTNLNGSKLNDGTYYYTCRVFENRVDGIIEQTNPLTGFIQLITGE